MTIKGIFLLTYSLTHRDKGFQSFYQPYFPDHPSYLWGYQDYYFTNLANLLIYMGFVFKYLSK